MKYQGDQKQNIKLKTKIGEVTISRNRNAMLTLCFVLSGPIQLVDISKNWNAWITAGCASVFAGATVLSIGGWYMAQTDLNILKKEK